MSRHLPHSWEQTGRSPEEGEGPLGLPSVSYEGTFFHNEEFHNEEWKATCELHNDPGPGVIRFAARFGCGKVIVVGPTWGIGNYDGHFDLVGTVYGPVEIREWFGAHFQGESGFVEYTGLIGGPSAAQASLDRSMLRDEHHPQSGDPGPGFPPPGWYPEHYYAEANLDAQISDVGIAGGGHEAPFAYREFWFGGPTRLEVAISAYGLKQPLEIIESSFVFYPFAVGEVKIENSPGGHKHHARPVHVGDSVELTLS